MSVAVTKPSATEDVQTNYLPPWTRGPLEAPPRTGWRFWVGLLGPGIVLAGTSIGSGEWLFGPAVTAQYGATLLWLASISIILQVFTNLMMMRYTLYCGEPIMVGGMRTWPGPIAWISVYVVLDISAIWPYNASNAAVPLAAAILGKLPETSSDIVLVKVLGYTIFCLAFVPLIFGGTVYRMLEKVMTIKLVFVLGYLSFVAIFMVSRTNAWEVLSGFVQFGTVPRRADVVITSNSFLITRQDSGRWFTLRGRLNPEAVAASEKLSVLDFVVTQGRARQTFKRETTVPKEFMGVYRQMLLEAVSRAHPAQFFVRATFAGKSLEVQGHLRAARWDATKWTVIDSDGTQAYVNWKDVPPELSTQFEQLVQNKGAMIESLGSYVATHASLPPLDWAMLAAFAAIAGAGGLSNTLFSNYCRDKGWGMGARVGAIPSAIGARNIVLSHVGEVFEQNSVNFARWRGWLRHVFRDQMIWMTASFVGMALPCMLSLEFIRNSHADGNRVAAMTAEGMSQRYPDHAQLFWFVTLFCGFLVLAPGQVSVSDQIARRWTDIVWTGTRWAKRMAVSKVQHVYYSILAIYFAWGLVTLTFFDPLQIAKIGTILGNVALCATTFQAWYVNCRLLPKQLRPHWLLQVGTFICASFFMVISLAAALTW